MHTTLSREVYYTDLLPLPTAPLLAVAWLWPGNVDVQYQYVIVGLGFPVIPRRLLERMQRWEYINFSQLIPFCEGEELDPIKKAKYVLFPSIEAQLGEGRHQDYSFAQLRASSYTWQPWQGNSQRPYRSSVPTSTIF